MAVSIKPNHSCKRSEQFFNLFWLFFIASFLGVVIESLWCILTRGMYESRSGLIYGPFNLIYGFGAVIMTLCLHPIRYKSDQVIFFGGFLIGSIFEYICSYVQQQWFGTVSWDYSHFWFNLDGRINLLYSCFWGLLAIAWIRWFSPKILSWIQLIPHSCKHCLTWLLVCFMVFNTVISAVALNRQTERRECIPANNAFELLIDQLYPDERLAQIYPNMIYVE